MAYDERLAERVRELLAPREGVSEQKMFGGIGFMIGGRMACAVTGDDLMVRLDPDDARRAVTEPGVSRMVMRGRPTRSWIRVASESLVDDVELAGWVDAGADIAAHLPPK